jgi:hypothetical protein
MGSALVAKLEDYTAARGKQGGGLIDQASVNFRAGRASKQSRVWFVLEHLARQALRFIAGDIGRIARDQVEMARGGLAIQITARAPDAAPADGKTVEQVALCKVHALSNSMPEGVPARHFERRAGNIDREDLRCGQFARQRDRNASRASSQVDDPEGSRVIPCPLSTPEKPPESHLDNMFGLRSRNQNMGIYLEFETPEFLVPDEVLRGLPAGPSGYQREVPLGVPILQDGFRMRVEPGPVLSERMHQQEFGCEGMRRDAGVT